LVELVETNKAMHQRLMAKPIKKRPRQKIDRDR